MKEHKKEERLSEQPVEGSENQAEAAVEMPEKFTSNEQLRRAYEALEAEFTRRSQQLAALKKEHGLLKEQRLKELKERECELEASRRAEAVDEFIRRYPKAADIKAELEGSIADAKEGIEQILQAAYMDILDRRYIPREQLFDNEEFISGCIENERIYDAVVQRYLSSLCSCPSPVLKRGGYIPLRKRNRAATLDDAAIMTRELYKR